MRIVMTTDPVGGVWPFTIELTRALAASGTQVVLACLGGEAGAARRREVEQMANAVLHEAPYRLEWMHAPWDDVERAGEWLNRLVHRTRADLVHLNCYGPAGESFGVPVLLTVHSCVFSWWRATHGEDPGPEWRRYRDCVVRALGAADRIVAPTHALLEAVRGCYEDTRWGERACVIHNGVDTAAWPAAREPGEPFVLGVGRVWDEAKNLRALAAVADSRACPVWIAGEGALGEGEEGAAGVVMLGPQPRAKLAEYYGRAAAFAHPARYEPFGLAVLEAALCGCPLVLGDIASLRELWDGAAQFIDPNDAHAWRETLEALIADPGARRERGRAARARALGYDSRRMAAGYLTRYRELLALQAEGAA